MLIGSGSIFSKKLDFLKTCTWATTFFFFFFLFEKILESGYSAAKVATIPLQSTPPIPH